MRPLLVVIIAYLIGSIPFGYLIVRRKVGDDIRQSGSGGTGATNVSRKAGKVAGVFTLVLDALKGSVAVLIARVVLGPSLDVGWWVAAAAIATIVGHIFPVWLGFKGGKGVATGVGVFLILAYAFTELKLHRLEANIQPHNAASIALVKRAGFVREGFSRRYLKICGEWRDHERWAILVEDWLAAQEHKP